GPGSIGDVGCDLHAAVHRTGVHDHHPLARAVQALGREAEGVVVLAQRGKAELPLPLELDAEHHEQLRAVHGRIERKDHGDAGGASAIVWVAPVGLWRITIMPCCMAIGCCAVSVSVSPFSTEEPEAEKFSVSADRRFSAISNETRVRVDASMKRLMTSWPRSAGTFFTGRSLTSLKPSAVSRISVISSGVSGSMPG